MRDRYRSRAISGVSTTYIPVMNPVLETVVRSSPAVCNAYPAASRRPRKAPPTAPLRPRSRTRFAAGSASVPVAIANLIARKAKSG